MTVHLHLLQGLRAIARRAEPQQQDCPTSQHLLPHLPMPASSFPQGERGEKFYLSITKLRRATSMCLSMDGRRITGLLLTYIDGTVAALGRVCLAKLQRSEPLYTGGIWILVELVDRYPQVVSVASKKPERNADRYLHVRWLGELEWWSSAWQCELHYYYHYHKQTLPTRL